MSVANAGISLPIALAPTSFPRSETANISGASHNRASTGSDDKDRTIRARSLPGRRLSIGGYRNIFAADLPLGSAASGGSIYRQRGLG